MEILYTIISEKYVYKDVDKVTDVAAKLHSMINIFNYNVCYYNYS